MSGIVVAGAGQAGLALVAKLRAEGYHGPLKLLGEEAWPPYQRPPLSKKFLLGDLARERLYLRSREFYAEHDIDLRLGARVEAIDREAGTVTFGDEALAYDRLVLTTGATPRRLPTAIGGDLGNVFTLRGIDDVDAMAPLFVPGARLLVVGGGYIGLEAAAVAARSGLKVTLIESAPRILGRVAAKETADYFRALHRENGVDLREGTRLRRLLGGKTVEAAELADGATVYVDLVIVGIGVQPATALAEEAGLVVDNGIATDAFGRTADPAIWAAGDCASFPNAGGRLRLESVQNAIEHAECVARNLLGAEMPYRPEPWFWSDQYEVKLQIAGLNTGYDRVVVRKGDREGSVSHWYFTGRRFIAIDAMNDPRAYMTGRRLLGAGISPDPDDLAAADLKTLTAA
ncbi:NAD(P)/FAD-dependent oxidoreductase [Martelella radicis]|uniref:3-phenylpropionate/trans-cinnamate dioxygenase ferredoxin reductase subunit n=1 Tax=Martelella radicis TaxID=1397476 RepID=A0A7W6KN98_9HYPH|nr:FAD-dependent oxidoreductase [Martelella radicis]MBB4124260.1 3-phenylpropionate/trans-cinnamate dioxygenase ferredoxin reductase subunit [Martelella radicis]